MALSRRELLSRTAVGVGVVALGDLTSLFSPAAAGALPAAKLGDLVQDPAGILELPKGFSYKIVSRAGDPLPGGGVVPGSPDGTAAFRGPKGRTVLVRNHELGTSAAFPTVAAPELTYDPKLKGGTTTLVLDRASNVVSQHVSLAGTSTNCAGGHTPWGSWLTCEETELKAGATADKDHGFVFEVDATRPENNLTPTPLKEMGRFAHEAVAVDPARGHVYLTEDASNPNGLVYRFTPHERAHEYGALRDGGRLEAMACSFQGAHVPDLSVFQAPGTRLQVRWVAVPDPLAASLSIRKQLANDQVTRSRKIEGMWWGDGDLDVAGGERAHIVCSYARLSDGSLAEHDGQVWAYDPGSRTLTLEVRFGVNADPDASLSPDGPDNITVSPYGGLFLAEDGEGIQQLLAVDTSGQTRSFARNRLSGSEFAGVCFSPDAKTLFAHLQGDGLTFAITGPFQKAT